MFYIIKIIIIYESLHFCFIKKVLLNTTKYSTWSPSDRSKFFEKMKGKRLDESYLSNETLKNDIVDGRMS